MSRRSLFRGLLGLILVTTLLGAVGVAAYQFGLVQGAGMEASIAHMGMRGYASPWFFWGFGLLRFVLGFLFFAFLLRLLFLPWGMRRRWKGVHDGPWGERMKEVHDRWHDEFDGAVPDEPPAES